jgi:membrane protein DedA with SNARE-associated domain
MFRLLWKLAQKHFLQHRKIMDTTPLTQFFSEHPWIAQSGYLGMFVIFLLDGGPVTTALGAFAVRAGIFNGWVIFLLVILGNFIPDMLFYAIGYKGRCAIEKYGSPFGITHKRMEAIKGFYKDHPWKILFAVKMIPFIPPAGLAAAGAAGMPAKLYALRCMVIIVPTSALFYATGYCAGEAYAHTVKYQVYALMVIAIGFLVIGRLYPKLAARLGKRVAPEIQNIE